MSSSKKIVSKSKPPEVKKSVVAKSKTPAKGSATKRKRAVAAVVESALPTAVLRPVARAVSAPVLNVVGIKPVSTTIVARLDIGFGNALYLRGEGGGLGWDRGVLMSCVEGNFWRAVLEGTEAQVVFKFLVNDLTWNSGPNLSVAAGVTISVVPEF